MADLRSHPEQDEEHDVMILLTTPPIPHRSLIRSYRSSTCTLNFSSSHRKHAKKSDGQGATPQELLIEACRRNNTDLLQEVIEGCASPEKAAVLLNETKTVMGNYLYHEAALAGNCAFYFLSPVTLISMNSGQ
jgi:hypothetical protein